MNKIAASLILTLIYTMASAQVYAPGNSLTPYHPDKEIRAVWLATIGGIDWPRTYASTSSAITRQKQELTDMLDKLKKININTVLLQTRVRGTVIYPSKYEPWDGCMSGKPGVSPGYDPLRFAIDECHKRGMELHAWVVTIPVGKWNNMGCRLLRQKYPKLITKTGDEGYLNPEQPQTADYLSDICQEIIKNYNVDGIHLDYIRYPETWRGRTSKAQGRENITRIVRKIHDRVKMLKPDVKLSCSPLGKHDDLARYSSRGWNARTTVCQDAQAWLRDGLMDQLYPMIYFKENNFYPFAIDWAEHSKRGQVAAGLGIYFLDPKEGNWKIDEIKRQLNVSRQLGLGQCFFRAKFLIDNIKGLYDYLRVFNFQQPRQETVAKEATISEVSDNKPVGAIPFISSRKGSVSIPANSKELDADMVMVSSMAGNAITTKRWQDNMLNVSDLQPGMYVLYSLNRKGNTHRIAYLQILHPALEQ
ncbi:MAG: family 10 glycosylhydrolase [Prevotella sp.]|nr:family 10 glycosylhydrolase [Prevotella sp.]